MGTGKCGLCLIHFQRMFDFYTPLKGYRNWTLVENELMEVEQDIIQ